eukprot:UN03224
MTTIIKYNDYDLDGNLITISSNDKDPIIINLLESHFPLTEALKQLTSHCLQHYSKGHIPAITITTMNPIALKIIILYHLIKFYPFYMI